MQALKEYGHNIGMSFQIVDDILDFVGQKETLGKPVAADLAQGVFTLPVILLLERPESAGVKGHPEEEQEEGDATADGDGPQLVGYRRML